MQSLSVILLDPYFQGFRNLLGGMNDVLVDRKRQKAMMINKDVIPQIFQENIRTEHADEIETLIKQILFIVVNEKRHKTDYTNEIHFARKLYTSH